MQFYDDEELQKLFKYLEYTDLTFKTAIYLLVLGGLRRGEALGLEYSHINFQEKTISIKQNLLNVRKKVFILIYLKLKIVLEQYHYQMYALS